MPGPPVAARGRPGPPGCARPSGTRGWAHRTATPGRAGAQRDRVRQGHRLEHRPQLVVAVLADAEHLEAEVDLGEGRERDRRAVDEPSPGLASTSPHRPTSRRRASSASTRRRPRWRAARRPRRGESPRRASRSRPAPAAACRRADGPRPRRGLRSPSGPRSSRSRGEATPTMRSMSSRTSSPTPRSRVEARGRGLASWTAPGRGKRGHEPSVPDHGQQACRPPGPGISMRIRSGRLEGEKGRLRPRPPAPSGRPGVRRYRSGPGAPRSTTSGRAGAVASRSAGEHHRPTRARPRPTRTREGTLSASRHRRPAPTEPGRSSARPSRGRAPRPRPRPRGPCCHSARASSSRPRRSRMSPRWSRITAFFGCWARARRTLRLGLVEPAQRGTAPSRGCRGRHRSPGSSGDGLLEQLERLGHAHVAIGVHVAEVVHDGSRVGLDPQGLAEDRLGLVVALLPLEHGAELEEHRHRSGVRRAGLGRVRPPPRRTVVRAGSSRRSRPSTFGIVLAPPRPHLTHDGERLLSASELAQTRGPRGARGVVSSGKRFRTARASSTARGASLVSEKRLDVVARRRLDRPRPPPWRDRRPGRRRLGRSSCW